MPGIYKQLMEDIDDIAESKFTGGDYMRGTIKTMKTIMPHSKLFHFDTARHIEVRQATATRPVGLYYKVDIQFKGAVAGNKRKKGKNSERSKGHQDLVQDMTHDTGVGETAAAVIVHHSFDQKGKIPDPALMRALLKQSGSKVAFSKAGVCPVDILVLREDLTWVNETSGIEGTPEELLEMEFKEAVAVV